MYLYLLLNERYPRQDDAVAAAELIIEECGAIKRGGNWQIKGHIFESRTAISDEDLEVLEIYEFL